MLFGFHEQVVRQGPRPFEDESLFRRIETEIPDASENTGDAHRDRDCGRTSANAADIFSAGVKRFSKHVQSRERSQDSKGGVREKNRIACGDVHMDGFSPAGGPKRRMALSVSLSLSLSLSLSDSLPQVQ